MKPLGSESNISRSKIFFLSALLCVAFIKSTNACTYQLSYDAVLNSTEVQSLEEELKVPAERRGELIFLETATQTIGKQIVDVFFGYPERRYHDKQHVVNVECLPRRNKIRCFIDYDLGGLRFTVDSAMKNNSDALGISFDVTLEEYKHPAPTDTTYTARNEKRFVARDALIYILNHIDHSIATKTPPPLWSIDVRPSPMQQNKNLHELKEYHQIPPSSEGTLEKMVLSNSNALSRTPLYPPPRGWEMTDQTKNLSVDIWKVEEFGRRPVTSLFMDGKLRATTGEAGLAHAEAFVHPALLALPDPPRRIAVISDMPLAFLKEVLKYKSIEEVSLVGSNTDAMNLAIIYMDDSFNKCYMNGESKDCLQDNRVNVVAESVNVWLDSQLDEGFEKYDAILIDVASPDQYDEFLSSGFSEKIQQIIESVVVFNCGSQPALNTDGVVSNNLARDDFLEMLTLQEYSEYSKATLYDELSAHPFDTTFIVAFPFTDSSEDGLLSETERRFVRSTITSVDLDIVDRFHKQQGLPTRFYDGSTHANYLIPSRIWETWYCQSGAGQHFYACKTFLQNFYDPLQHQGKTEVKRDKMNGRGLYASTNISKGAFINADDSHLNMHIHTYQWEALNEFIDDYPDAHMYIQLRDFFLAYGYANESFGLSGWTVSIANMNTFMNHACVEENRSAGGIGLDIDPWGEDILFSPLGDRRKLVNVITIATRDIMQGEEIQMDYSGFRLLPSIKYTELLESFCRSGEGLVTVDYEGKDGKEL